MMSPFDIVLNSPFMQTLSLEEHTKKFIFYPSPQAPVTLIFAKIYGSLGWPVFILFFISLSLFFHFNLLFQIRELFLKS